MPQPQLHIQAMRRAGQRHGQHQLARHAAGHPARRSPWARTAIRRRPRSALTSDRSGAVPGAPPIKPVHPAVVRCGSSVIGFGTSAASEVRCLGPSVSTASQAIGIDFRAGGVQRRRLGPHAAVIPTRSDAGPHDQGREFSRCSTSCRWRRRSSANSIPAMHRRGTRRRRWDSIVLRSSLLGSGQIDQNFPVLAQALPVGISRQ